MSSAPRSEKPPCLLQLLPACDSAPLTSLFLPLVLSCSHSQVASPSSQTEEIPSLESPSTDLTHLCPIWPLLPLKSSSATSPTQWPVQTKCPSDPSLPRTPPRPAPLCQHPRSQVPPLLYLSDTLSPLLLFLSIYLFSFKYHCDFMGFNIFDMQLILMLKSSHLWPVGTPLGWSLFPSSMSLTSLPTFPLPDQAHLFSYSSLGISHFYKKLRFCLFNGKWYLETPT